MKHIVVIGGGFGGVYTVKHLLTSLKNNAGVKITLMSKNNYFLFTPMLHEVATGGLNRHHIVEPIRNIFTARNFAFVQEEANKIDISKKTVITPSCTIKYDYLVLAPGSTTNFFNIPGAKDYCLDLKNLHAAAKVRNRIIASLETASTCRHENDALPYLTFVVVGGGPTGVELSAEIAEFVRQMMTHNYRHLRNNFRVYLVQKGDRIIPFMHPRCIDKAMQELRQKGVTLLLRSEATRVFPDGVEINKGEKIPSRTIIWTSGVMPTVIPATPRVADDRGYLPVDSFLQVKGVNNVFALGDCALFYNPDEKKPAPSLAQTATIQARVVAKNILHRLHGEPLEECRVQLKGLLVSVGQKYAVADLHGIRFKGFFAWWLWRTIYLFKLLGKANRIRVAIEWTINLFSRRDTSQV